MDYHAATVPVFSRVLASMLSWIDKAEASAQQRGFAPDAFLPLRLAPDMLPLAKQIQIASDAAKACMARLAGREVPSWPDDETTLAQLRERIQRTRDYVLTFGPDDFAQTDGRTITVPRRNADALTLKPVHYVAHFATPNLYFHATTLYALLRGAGVPLGKADYLGGGS